MVELSHIFASLISAEGQIQIDGLSDQVLPVTDDEKEMYKNIDFELERYRGEVGCGRLLSDDKTDLLMRRWRYPSLSIHGVQGAFAEPGEKTVIPAKVIGKFSIRLVPAMTPDHVEKVVVDHVMKVHEKLNTKNKVKCFLGKGPSVPWVTNPKNENFQAAVNAIKKVRGVEPDLTREGCSIPGLDPIFIRMNSEKFQNFHFKPKLSFLRKKIIKMITESEVPDFYEFTAYDFPLR